MAKGLPDPAAENAAAAAAGEPAGPNVLSAKKAGQIGATVRSGPLRKVLKAAKAEEKEPAEAVDRVPVAEEPAEELDAEISAVRAAMSRADRCRPCRRWMCSLCPSRSS